MSVFASGPDRLPYRQDCLLLTMFFYFLLGFALIDQDHGYGVVLLQILLEVLLLALLTYLGLLWLKKLSRFWQCLSALVGVNFIISIASIPIFNWLAVEVKTDSAIDTRLLYVTMAMVFWNLAAISQILKRSFEINTVMSAMLAFNYFLIYQFTVVWI